MDGAEQQHGEDAQGPRVDERPLQPDESGPQMRGDDAATSTVPFLGGPVSPELQRQQAMLFQQAELHRAYVQQLQAAGLPPPGAGPGIGVFNVGAFVGAWDGNTVGLVVGYVVGSWLGSCDG